MRKCLLIFILLIPNIALSASLNLERDANGWTIFTPSETSRITYVSESGGATCPYYSPSDPLINGTPFTPGAVETCSSYAAAWANTREGYPDWILIKRGDTFTEAIGNKVLSGLSESQPALIGAYGSIGNSPLFRVPITADAGIKTTGARQFLAVSGLSFYAYTRNPDDPGYVNSASEQSGISIYSEGGWDTHSILVEGCKFSFFSSNIISGSLAKYITFRRNILTDTHNNDVHSQGLFIAYASESTIEENVLDHNGWLNPAGSGLGSEANAYNHNSYMSSLVDTSIKDNIFSRPSSINIKLTGDTGQETESLFISGNLFIDGEIGISAGGNAKTAYRFVDCIIDGNVMTDLNIGRSRNQDLAIGIDLQDWDGGYVRNNLIVHSDESNSYAIGHTGTSRNVTIASNTIYNFKNIGRVIDFDSSRGVEVTGSTIIDNLFQIPTLAGYTVMSDYDPLGKWVFSGNKYYTSKDDGARFSIASADMTDSQWATITGDTSTYEQHSFPDPTRSIETYMASLGETATIDAFIAKARAQDRYNWRPAYTADAVNDYIRAGFGMGQRRLFRNVRIGEVEP